MKRRFRLYLFGVLLLMWIYWLY